MGAAPGFPIYRRANIHALGLHPREVLDDPQQAVHNLINRFITHTNTTSTEASHDGVT